MYSIYKCTSPSKKSYIGYTNQNIDDRWYEHITTTIHYDWKFSRALRKYPNEDQWIREILINNILTIKEAKNLEILYIFYYDTFVNGYNSTIGEDGHGPTNEETKRKISIAHKGKKFSEERKRKLSEIHKCISNNQLGLKRSIESKKKMSNSQKGNKNASGKRTEETKNNISNALSKINWEIIFPFPDNHKENIKNLSKFCKENHLNKSAMSKVAQGKLSHHHGFKCEKIL